MRQRERKKSRRPITRDKARHRRMIVLAKTHDDVLDGGHTLAFKVAYGATQHLRQIEHY